MRSRCQSARVPKCYGARSRLGTILGTVAPLHLFIAAVLSFTLIPPSAPLTARQDALGFSFTNVAARRVSTRVPSTAASRPTGTCWRPPAAASPRSTTTATAGSTSSSSTARRSRASPKGRSRPATSTATAATARSRTSPRAPELAHERLGPGRVRRRLRQRRPRGPVRDLLGAEPALPQPGRRRVRGRDREGGPHERPATRAGAPAARSSTTTATAASTSSPPTTSTSTWPRRRRPTPASAATRACRSPAGRPGCPAARTCSTATAATARSRTCPDAVRHHAAPAAPTASASAPSTSTTTAGSTSTWPTTRTRARSTATTATARSPTSASPPAAPTARTASRRPAWASPSATTIATAPMDIFKTNFAGDTSTLYANTGEGFCEDRTFAGGIGVNTRWLGWGAGFVDLDNDGWLDLFLVNGHVYPEVEQLKTEAGYKQRKVVYRNLRQRPVRGRHRAPRPAGHHARRPAAARRSATSTTTATWTSSSTTCTTRPTSSGSTSSPRRERTGSA